YVDDPDPDSYGLVATAIVKDLIPAVDKSLPTAACRQGRAIGGVSMGGVGAALQVVNHPDTYVAAMSLSGALHQPLGSNDPRLAWLPRLYKGVFGDPFDAHRFNTANVFNQLFRLRSARFKPSFYLTVGDNDSPDLIEAAALLHDRLRQSG